MTEDGPPSKTHPRPPPCCSRRIKPSARSRKRRRRGVASRWRWPRMTIPCSIAPPVAPRAGSVPRGFSSVVRHRFRSPTSPPPGLSATRRAPEAAKLSLRSPKKRSRGRPGQTPEAAFLVFGLRPRDLRPKRSPARRARNGVLPFRPPPASPDSRSAPRPPRRSAPPRPPRPPHPTPTLPPGRLRLLPWAHASRASQ